MENAGGARISVLPAAGRREKLRRFGDNDSAYNKAFVRCICLPLIIPFSFI